MTTQTLNETQQTIANALHALKFFGRAQGALVDDEGRFCPLQALFYARTGCVEMDRLEAYVDTNDVAAVAQAFYERFNDDSDEFTLEDFKTEANKNSWIHAYNDETADDDVIFALMERAIEIAGEES